MPFILGANSLAGGGYQIDNSLRFNSGSSDYLNRTPASTTNQKTWTYSFWIKRAILGTTQHFLYARNDDNNRSYFRFNTTDTLGFFAVSSASVKLEGTITSRVFRDVSAWYHIVLSADTTQATSANRFKVYVNGTEQTLTFDTTPSQNSDLSMNIAHPTAIGVYADGLSGYLNGYMSEIYMIDGQQLDSTSFGEFDEDTGIWKPIKYTGTYGTNGFFLEFQSSGALGTDTSGNGNNFTVNNLTSIDQTTDTPTNNFATLNPIGNTNTQYANFSEGNLKVAGNSASSAGFINSTIAPSQGKWYMEFKAIDIQGTSYPAVGMISSQDATNNDQIGNSANSVSYRAGGTILTGGSVTDTESSYTDNDIIGIAMDLDNGAVYFSKNGTWQNSGDPTSGASRTGSLYNFTPSDFYHFATTVYDTTSIVEANFGNPPFTIASGNSDQNGIGNFEYLPPTGYLALCTANLSENL